MQEIKDKVETREQEVESEPGLFNAGSASAGPMLRAARKEKSMSVEDVSEQLNLSNSVVDAIENDSWEHLPEATYVRGYIRSYARLLGIDPADVLMSFRYNNSEQNISLDSMPRKIEDRKISFSIPKKIKLLLFVGAIAALVAYLYNEQAMSLLESKIGQVTQVSDSDTPPVSSTQSTNQEDEGETVVESKVDNVVDSKSSEDKDEVVATETTLVGKEVKELLELEFSATSWVDIRDKAGKKIVYKSFAPGGKTSVKASLPIYVFIGNADAVNMNYQGKEIDLQKYKEEVYAKFTLGE